MNRRMNEEKNIKVKVKSVEQSAESEGVRSM